MHQKSYSAVVIQAPAGHGKSTLMSQIKQQYDDNNFSTGWLSFESGDDDISHFSRLLRMLIENIVRSKSDKNILGPFHHNNTSGAVEDILHLLSLIEGNVAIFFDELQCITESVNIDFLETIIERSPLNICFYIGTRTIPKLVKGKLFISGKIRWVTSIELCFNLEEFTDFIRLVGLEISEPDAEAFLEQTGGWPAVLQLLHLALKGEQVNKTTLFAWVKGSIQPLAQYLADNVMLNQSDEKKEFLIKTSILKQLTAPLCEVITGNRKSGLILEEFVEQGLFIQPTDYNRKWFKYHSIFSSYLAEQLKLLYADKIKDIHQKASFWYRDNKHYEEAIEHSLSAGDYNLAAEVLNKWIPELVSSARLKTIDSLCEKIPERAYFNRPFLCWGRIWAKYFLSKSKEASKHLQDFSDKTPNKASTKKLRQSISILKCIDLLFKDQIDELSIELKLIDFEVVGIETYNFFEIGVLFNLRVISKLQHLEFTEAKELATKAELISMKGHAAFSSAYTTSLLALALIQQGQLSLAISKLQDRLNSPELKIQGSFATSSLSAIYGFALYEAGSFIEAESHLSDTIDLIIKCLPLDWVILATLALFRSRTFIENSTENSIRVLNEAEANAQYYSQERFLEVIKIERYRVQVISDPNYLSHQSKNTALEVSQKTQDVFHLAEGSHDKEIHAARFYISTGKIENAIEFLKITLNHLTTSKWVRRELKIRTLLALAYNKSLDKANAENMMLSAISLSKATGLISNFIEEGQYCLNFISNLSSSMHSKDSLYFIHKALSLNNNDANNDIPISEMDEKLVETLTKRELDILKLVANGSTNTEISDLLFISYNTVKFHMKNLYGKLNAKNRVILIAVATQNKLI
jgi:LuxR family maltose regulon positive regulatory protein